jgi:AcrR family transcriptional regulator
MAQHFQANVQANGKSAQSAAKSKSAACRRRCERSHQAILQAAIELLEETGYRGVSIEAIAARAGVGKQTIYRWWSCKAAVIMEAYTTHAAENIPIPDTGSVKEDLCQILQQLFTVLTTTSAGATIAGLIAEAQTDSAVAATFREKFVASRRAATRVILERGMARGELRPNLNLELAIDTIYGPVWYRLLLKHAALDQAFAAELVCQLVGGMGAGAAQNPSSDNVKLPGRSASP